MTDSAYVMNLIASEEMGQSGAEDSPLSQAAFCVCVTTNDDRSETRLLHDFRRLYAWYGHKIDSGTSSGLLSSCVLTVPRTLGGGRGAGTGSLRPEPTMTGYFSTYRRPTDLQHCIALHESDTDLGRAVVLERAIDIQHDVFNLD